MLQADQVRSGVAMGVELTDLSFLLGCSRAALHKHAQRDGIALRPRPSRTPSLAGWQNLISLYGLDTLKLAGVTGLRRSYVQDQLEKHELIECE